MCCKAYCDAYLRLNEILDASYFEESFEELKLGKNDHCLTNLCILNVSNSYNTRLLIPAYIFSFLIDYLFQILLLIEIR